MTVLELPPITPLARLLLSRVPAGQSCPRYGTDAWHELPDQDPRRAAAIMRAAEAWRRHCSPWQIERDMRDALAESRDVIAPTLVGTSHDVAEAAEWERILGRFVAFPTPLAHVAATSVSDQPRLVMSAPADVGPNAARATPPPWKLRRAAIAGRRREALCPSRPAPRKLFMPPLAPAKHPTCNQGWCPHTTGLVEPEG